MKPNGQNIIEKLAVHLSIDYNNTEQLQAILEQYPYFGFAQLLLAKNLKNSGNTEAEKQLQKTALYFSNPLWLHYLLTIYETPAAQTLSENAENEEEKTINTKTLIHSRHEDGAAESTVSTETVVEEAEELAEREKLSRLIENHLSTFKQPVKEDDEIPFEKKVYHTIDYFASQGIKLDFSQSTQDQLGNKVKKFTDWLKQMKRVNPQPSDLGTDEATEHLIETIAQSSNEAKEIVTEAMAEVLLKQGKKEKAIKLYEKLSFLNPPKSTYFAAKINELKDLQ